MKPALYHTFHSKQDRKSLTTHIEVRTFGAFKLIVEGSEGRGEVLLHGVDNRLLRRQWMRFHVLQVAAITRKRRQTGNRRENPRQRRPLNLSVPR